jgi:hypothetical protein
LSRLEELAKTFGDQIKTTEEPRPAQSSPDPSMFPPQDPMQTELPEIPREHDPRLELVCWIHII